MDKNSYNTERKQHYAAPCAKVYVLEPHPLLGGGSPDVKYTDEKVNPNCDALSGRSGLCGDEDDE